MPGIQGNYKPKGLPSTGKKNPLDTTKEFSNKPGAVKGGGANSSHPQSDHESPIFTPGGMKKGR